MSTVIENGFFKNWGKKERPLLDKKCKYYGRINQERKVNLGLLPTPVPLSVDSNTEATTVPHLLFPLFS